MPMVSDNRDVSSGQNPRSQAAGASACRDRLWDAVFRSPSIFGRLWEIAALLDSRTGRYTHPSSQLFGAAVVDTTLRAMHQDVFNNWLELHLRQQERDLLIWHNWRKGSDEDLPDLIESIEHRLKDLAPKRSRTHETGLFQRDLTTVLGMLKQSGGSPVSSRKPLKWETYEVDEAAEPEASPGWRERFARWRNR